VNDHEIGFLAENGVLYCSRNCAVRDGQQRGMPVDESEYGDLPQTGPNPHALCPVCGEEYTWSWNGEDRPA
jgi:hypothetical protein